MLSFRQKIFLTYFVIFFIFIALMSPFASLIVHRIVENVMENRAKEIIESIQSAPNNEGIVRRLKELKSLIFFRVSVITDEKKVIYDTHTKRLLGPRFSQEHVVDHPEVVEAIEKGVGYNEDYSDILEQKFAYTAVAFDFHGKKYVLRNAFPYRYVRELKEDFEAGFLMLATAVLLLFSLLTWFVLNYLTKPIHQIISAVNLYRQGGENSLREVKKLSLKVGGGEDIGNLASTLLSLAEQVDHQINSLKTERNEKEVLLESLIEGVVAVDNERKITFANEAALQFLGKSKEEILGSPIEKQGLDKASALIVSAQKEKRPLVDSIQKSTNGVTYFLDLVAVPKQDDTGAVLVLIDQSPHHKILEMRKEFIANASHELKTPITIIRGFAETLYDHPQLPVETTKEITGKIVKNCERMALLVRDLLALADIENLSQTRLESLDVLEMLQRIRLLVLEMFPEASIEIQNLEKAPLKIEADPYLLEMAFLNLIQNGVKYSTPPAKITIKIQVIENKLLVAVEDQGIGIPEADLPKIFERFYRVNKTHSQKVSGSGLGLAIVENVIRKHYGKVSVKSEIGKGSVFTVELPMTLETRDINAQ